MKHGKNSTQNFVEMVETLEKSKTDGLNLKRGQSLYKMQSDEHKKSELQKLISMNIQELTKIATTEKISLENIDEVKRRTLIYLKACEETGVFPSQVGLAKSIGYTDRSLRLWRQKHSNTPTGIWLEQFSDTCSDILSQSGLNNNCNSIVSIFLNKALYGLREASEIVLSPNTTSDEQDYDIEEIKARYAVED